MEIHYSEARRGERLKPGIMPEEARRVLTWNSCLELSCPLDRTVLALRWIVDTVPSEWSPKDCILKERPLTTKVPTGDLTARDSANAV
jgi:hypothetical protein